MAAQKKKKLPPTSLDSIPMESRTEVQHLAVAIQQARPDLEPSVRRILEAEIEESQRLHALQLFEVALTSPGDPNRDPRVAITASA